MNGTTGSGGPVSTSSQVWVNGAQNLTTLGRFGSRTTAIDLYAGSAAPRGRLSQTGQFIWGVPTNASPDQLNSFGSTTYPFAIAGYTTGNGTGVWGEVGASSSTYFSGVQGNYAGSGTGAGVTGSYAGSNSQARGVFGGVTTAPSAVTPRGVEGFAGAAANANIGVYGSYDPAKFGYGVVGVGFNGAVPTTGNLDFGVLGIRSPNTNYSGYFIGNHAVANGTKSASVGTSKGNQLLYVVESPEVWFEDIGSATLVNGRVVVPLDPLFLETVHIDAKHPMQVFLQEQGDSNGLYVIPGATSFEVREKRDGRSNIAFSYRVLAKRLHFADHRFGSDPVFGPGDTRKYQEDAVPPPVDFEEARALEDFQRRYPRKTRLPPGFKILVSEPPPTR